MSVYAQPRRADVEDARVARLGHQAALPFDKDLQTWTMDDEAENRRHSDKAWDGTGDGEKDGVYDGGSDGEDEKEDDILERRIMNTRSQGRKRDLADGSGSKEVGSDAEDRGEMHDPVTMVSDVILSSALVGNSHLSLSER